MDHLTLPFLERFKTSTCIPVSSASLLMYDTLLTLPVEIRYVWGSSWSLGKVLYLLARYPILFNVIIQLHRNAGHDVSDAECHVLYALTGYMYLFGVLAAEAILVVRVWALWQRSRPIAWLLAFMTVAGLIVGLIAVFRLQGAEFFVPKDAIQSLSYPGCISVAGSNSTTVVSYIVLMTYESGIFALMIVNGFRSHLRLPSSSLMYSFYKDGLVYFSSLLIVSAVNLIVILTQPPEYTNLLISTQASLHSTLSTRMLLNLRHRSEQSRSNVSLASYTGSVDVSRVHIYGTSSANSNASIRFRSEGPGRAWFGHGSQATRGEVLIEMTDVRR